MKLNKEKIIVILLIMLAGVARLWRIDTDLLIHYDQGRDLLAVRDIWLNHKLTLLGPVADNESTGIFFGPWYYYLICLPLWLTGGNPVSAVVFLISLELVSLIFLYLGARKMLGRRVALWSLCLMAVSYGLASYSRWLSNAMPVVMVGNLLIYWTARLSRGEQVWRWWWLTLGGMFAFNPAAGIGLVPFGLAYQWKRTKNLHSWVTSGLFFLLPAVPQLVFELRHQFLISNGVLRMLTSIGSTSGWQEHWLATAQTMIRFFSGVIGGEAIVIIGGLVLILFSKQRVLFWMLVTQVAFLMVTKRAIFGHFYAGVAPILILLLVDRLLAIKRLGTVMVLALIVFNCYQIYNHFGRGGVNLTPIGTANAVTLANRLEMLDFIEETRGGRSYTLWTYTIPYYSDQPWEYLGWWRKLALPIERGELLYTLYERDWDRPVRQEGWLEEADRISSIVGTRQEGDFTVEKREWRVEQKER